MYKGRREEAQNGALRNTHTYRSVIRGGASLSFLICKVGIPIRAAVRIRYDDVYKVFDPVLVPVDVSCM